MNPFYQNINEIKAELQTNLQTGLSPEQVKQSLEKYGENKLKAKKKKSMLMRFLEQFKDVMVIILLIAAVISFVVALRGHEKAEYLEPIIILGIVLLNATMGVVQESKAQKALEALQDMSAPNAKVVRGGVTSVIPADQVVTGDVILLDAGDFVPADARLIESASLKSEESALTGESVPSEKDANAQPAENAGIGDRLNMVYSGCSVAYGRARAVVTSVGMGTEMGKIAKLLDSEPNDTTPLQVKLAKLGKYLGFVALGISAVIFVIGLMSGIPMMEIFITAVSLAVAAIPEGLPAIVTIVLAMGVQRMVKKNAIIRRLPAVETLGSASVICSDKTGTLTQNRMTLVKLWAGEQVADVQNSTLSEREITALRLAALCSDGDVQFEDGKEKHIGDPTETALVYAAYKNGMPKAKLNTEYPRVAEIPFDSDRKLMTTVNMIGGKPLAIVKGAYDVLIARCTSGDVSKAPEISDAMGRDALRVLAVACKELPSVPANPTSEELENGLTFIGLLGMIDPPREEAKQAVATCIRAGIKTVMITGDHVVTASAIAKELGILAEGGEALSGTELAKMSNEELKKNVRRYSVYARVSPEDKIRIVKAWQSSGEVVSMTGDGVNDAPALKAADIGCAMGITGTDVAKGAADMTLTDDNFATIVDAVKEGRGIYDNIKKSIQFLLGTNIGEVLTVLASMVLWQKTPLTAIQLLWINLVTDGLPALALGVEPVEPDIMDRKPKPKDEGLFAGGLGVRVLWQGGMFAILTLIGFWLGYKVLGSLAAAQTLAFIVLSLSQLFHAFNVRSSHSIFKVGLFTNRSMVGAFLISFALIGMLLFIPQIATIFGMILLPPMYYLYGLGLAVVPVVIVELVKLVHYLTRKK